MTDPDVATTLQADRNAAPAPIRAADFGGREDFLCVADGLASDRYAMIPASAVQVSAKTGTTAADLEPGRYSVAKIGAEPKNIGDAPKMGTLLQGVINREQVELRPFELDGIGHVHKLTRTRDRKGVETVTTIAVFIAEDGCKVGLDSDRLASLIDGAEHESIALPGFFGQYRPARYSLHTDAADKNGLKPVLVTRKVYGRQVRADTHESSVYCSGTWQAVLMPMKLGG